mmetsp:Transcript_158428/g.279604  ORF Transcript_158428/g.279604 Transcript_158428/m.279604 type:complete len:456 (+) Transcript_158428:96-1463(+)
MTAPTSSESASLLSSEIHAEEQQCAVCWELLCEPVTWPGCSHRFCLLCSLELRRRPKPSCPLCRAQAPRARKVSALQVDADCAAQVRQSVGYFKYESRRRKLWADASKPCEALRAVPIYGTELTQQQLLPGACLLLRLSEPRYAEMVRRAMAPGGTRRFAVVTWTNGSARGGEGVIAEGAMGRLCEIVEHSSGEFGTYVMVKTSSPCTVLAVRSDDSFPDSPPLLIGELEELEEEEDEPADGAAGEVGQDNAVVILEDSRTIRQQQMELELAALELQRAYLERRRLELSMLLTQRRVLQEMAELSLEVAQMTAAASTVQELLEGPRPTSGQRLQALRNRSVGAESSSIHTPHRRQAASNREARSSVGSRSNASNTFGTSGLFPFARNDHRSETGQSRSGLFSRNDHRSDAGQGRSRNRGETHQSRSRASGSSSGPSNLTQAALLQRRNGLGSRWT